MTRLTADHAGGTAAGGRETLTAVPAVQTPFHVAPIAKASQYASPQAGDHVIVAACEHDRIEHGRIAVDRCGVELSRDVIGWAAAGSPSSEFSFEQP